MSERKLIVLVDPSSRALPQRRTVLASEPVELSRQEGREKAKPSERPCLIPVEVMRPGRGGIAAGLPIRSRGETVRIPVIRGEPASPARGRAARLSDRVTLPAGPAELLEIIRTHHAA